MGHFSQWTRRVLFFLLWVGGIRSISLGQGNVKISGILVDSLTEETMPMVGVSLAGTSFGANTNLEGAFAIFAPPGKYLLFVRYSGYKVFQDSISVGNSGLSGLTIRISPVESGIEEVVITEKAINPALRVIRECNHHRSQNRFSKIDSYQYEAYTKLVITMDQVTEKFLDNKLIKGVGREVKEMLSDSSHTDSTTFDLAVFVSESVSRLYFQKPDLKREEILAIKTSGMKGSEYNLLSTMFLQIDVYENNIVILDKHFISPVADGAMLDYDFQVVSTEIEGRDTVWGIDIIPKSPFSSTFVGRVYIDNQDWAINRIELALNSNPNINFVEDVHIRQDFMKVDTTWVPALLDLEVNFQNSVLKKKGGDGPGVIGRSTSHFYSYTLNQPKEPRFYQGEVLEIVEGAEDHDSTYWAQARRSPLDKSEELGFSIVDSLKSRGFLDFYIDAITFLTWGTKKFKYFEIGPYFYLMGYNQAEGYRTRCGIYTTDGFSKRWYLGGHLAYGFGDHRLKYLAEARYRISSKPKIEVGIRKTHEVEQIGFDNFLNNGTSLLQTSLRRVPLTQLNYFDENRLYVNANISKGLTGEFYARTKFFEPANTFAFGWGKADHSLGHDFSIAEVGANFRISFKEKYITSGGERRYIGTKYPIFHLILAKGISTGIPQAGEFDYASIQLTANNWTRMGRWGWLRYHVRVGQVLGTVPYPALHVFRGNQTWAYDKEGFNMMNYYEFVADRYATLSLEHHLEGLILNKIPLIRALKWKEVLTARAAWGSLNPGNLAMNNVNFNFNGLPYQQTILAPTRVPYLEAGAGIENIFKVLQVHAIWRLNYQEHTLFPDGKPNPLHANWGPRNNFGVRVDLKIAF